MNRVLIFVIVIFGAGCADDSEPKTEPINTNSTTNNATTPPNNLSQCRDFAVEDCPSPCVVLTTSCGDLTLSGCFGEERPAGIPCGDLEPDQCQNQTTSDGCDREVCEWAQTGGCGEPGQLIFDEEPACIPKGDCTPGNEEQECPEEHTCWALSVDPCGGDGETCDACSAVFNRCVPNQFLPVQ